MNYSKTAKNILEKIGGEANIKSVTHCMTRLRFILKDEAIVDDEEMKNIQGVMGVMKKAGQYQIIIGNNVADCYKEIAKMGNFQDENANKDEGATAKKQSMVMRILDVISSCMSSLMPAIIGAGMVKVLVVLLGFVLPASSQTLRILTVVGDCAFYFLPILLAYSAGKKFGTNPMLVAAVAGVLLHPDFIALLSEGNAEFLGIPVIAASYSSTVIPILLTAWVMSYIDKFVDKITPSVTKNFLKPFLILLISAPVAFIILGPLGGVVGNDLAAVVYTIQGKVGFLALMIMSAAMPFIVMTGMHWAFVPIALTALATPAGDTVLLPAMLASNLAQGSACVAVALKSKNSDLKQVASASGFSALFAGITEPAMYGVTLKLKKPMWTACIASGITGIFIGATSISAYAFATPAIVAMPQFIGEGSKMNLLYACIAAVATIVLSFMLTWMVGFDDPQEGKERSDHKKETGNAELSENKQDTFSSTEGIEIASALSGAAVPLSMVDDATFSEEVLGKGVAVIPTEGKVFAPFDGEVSTIFDTKHAIGMISDAGTELLIHVGLETVSLGGKYFTAHVKDGQQIKKGELILEFDIDGIRTSGLDVITPIIVTNSDEYKEIAVKKGCRIKNGETLIKLDK